MPTIPLAVGRHELLAVVCVDGSRPLPKFGWIRSKADYGTFWELQRQWVVVGDFLGNRALIGQLVDPLGVEGIRDRWRRAGQGLKGRGGRGRAVHALVAELLRTARPPGTGKTTVAAHATTEYLNREPGARILVSAQSHYALDNIAERIEDRIRQLLLSMVDLVGEAHLLPNPQPPMRATRPATRVWPLRGRSSLLERRDMSRGTFPVNTDDNG